MSILLNSSNNGLLVVRRVDYQNDKRFNAVKRPPSVNYTDSEIIQQFKGIEGDSWPINDIIEGSLLHGLASLDQYDSVFQYFGDASRQFYCDLLYVDTSYNTARPSDLPHFFEFCGYDYGLFYSAYDNYSIVFNEVIYGAYDNLRYYSRYLNSNLLFSETDCLVRLEKDRTKLILHGADLESVDGDELCRTFAVYAVGVE